MQPTKNLGSKIFFLINLDHTINFSYEPKAGEESDCTCEDEEGEDNNRSVSKIKES